MNELIEELWDKHKTITSSGSGAFPEDYGELMYCKDFVEAILTACKAQRNACARHTNYKDDYTLYKTVENAEITKEDYE